MARFVSYRCPECGGIFKHLHHPSDAPPPERCTLCHAWVSDDEPPEEVFVPQAPGIRKSAYAKSVDQTYRAMEESSIDRARDAAEMAGVPEADMSHLKMTNMKDPSEMREGDTAAIMPSVSQSALNLKTASGGPGFQSLAGQVPNYAPGVGPSRAGDTARQQIGLSHSSRANAMIARGNMGSHRE